jgi:hypothetical protein
MKRSMHVLALTCLFLAGCAQLTDAEATWCGYHEDEVRAAARALGTEDEIEWRQTSGVEQYKFDATFAEACRDALERDPNSS